MNPPHRTVDSSSRKRKQPDEDEVQSRQCSSYIQPIENEYEHLDDGDDAVVGQEEEEETPQREKHFYKQTLGAQLPATIDSYDGIEMTPFNIRDELAQGEIDKAGNFILQKEELNEDNNDTWADSIDWSAVEQREKERREQEKESLRLDALESADETGSHIAPPEPPLDKHSCYRRMLRILRPDETVQKAIRRLGNSVPKRQTKGLTKTSNTSVTNGDTEKINEAKDKLNSLIEMAHKILEEGDMDIYERSYEQLEELINEHVL